MGNIAWKIDPDTHDLILDEQGILQTIEEDEASAQSIRLTLEARKGDFPLAPSHGTDYDQILGLPMDEEAADEAIREAAFQEERLAALDEVAIRGTDGRGMIIGLTGRLNDGAAISMEVTADG